jgi:hypothetical protein
VPWGTLKKKSYPIDLGGIMNARLIEKATTLKTTKGESQNAFKRTNQAKVSAIRLTHTGREVPPSGLKPNSRISTGDPLLSGSKPGGLV